MSYLPNITDIFLKAVIIYFFGDSIHHFTAEPSLTIVDWQIKLESDSFYLEKFFKKINVLILEFSAE